MIACETANFAPLKISQENVVHLPLGLLGFESMKDYVLLAEPGEEPFRWLQVLTDPTLAFLVVSPFEFMAGYEPKLAPEDVNFLNLQEPGDALVYNIVTLHGNGRATINLKGPIVLNRFSLQGKQVVITNAADYSVRHPLPVAE